MYLLQSDAIIGLPMYLHYVDGILAPSTREESMGLFDEPDYMGE